jgi:hypothetical protein
MSSDSDNKMSWLRFVYGAVAQPANTTNATIPFRHLEHFILRILRQAATWQKPPEAI